MHAAIPMIELEDIPESERRLGGTRFTPVADRPDQALPAEFTEPVGPDDGFVPSPFDANGERARNLEAHRRKADAQVRAEHLRIATAHLREARLWAAAAAVLAVAVTIHPVAGAVAGVASWFLFRPGLIWRLPDLALPLAFAGLAILAVGSAMIRAHGAERIALAILAVCVAAPPWIHRWLIAPMPWPEVALGTEASGRAMRERVRTSAAELIDHAAHQRSVTSVNDRIKAIVTRLTAARCAAGGAWLAVVGMVFASVQGQAGRDTAAGYVVMILVGTMIGWSVGWRRPGTVWSMLAMGIGLSGTHILLLIGNLAGFQIFTAMWVWLGWTVAGGLLGMAMETEDDAVAQRTS